MPVLFNGFVPHGHGISGRDSSGGDSLSFNVIFVTRKELNVIHLLSIFCARIRIYVPIVRQLCASCALARLCGDARWLPPVGRTPVAAGQAVQQDVHQLTTMRRYPELKSPSSLKNLGLQPAHASQGSLSSPHSRCPCYSRTTGMRTFDIILAQRFLGVDRTEKTDKGYLSSFSTEIWDNSKNPPVVKNDWKYAK